MLLKYSAAQAAEAKTIRFWALSFVLESRMMLKSVEVVLVVKRAVVVVDVFDEQLWHFFMMRCSIEKREVKRCNFGCLRRYNFTSYGMDRPWVSFELIAQ